MDEGVAMRGVQRVGDLRADAKQVRHRHRALGQTGRQRLAVQQLHHEVGGAVHVAHVKEGAHARVREARDGPGFAIETIARLVRDRHVGSEDLDGHEAVEPGVAGLVDLAHAAAAEWRQDLVRTEAGTGLKTH